MNPAQEEWPKDQFAFLPRDTLESHGLLTLAPQGTELSEDSTAMNRASNADVTFTASLSPVLQLKIFSCHCMLIRESNQQLMHTPRHRIEENIKQ